jgi:hypothetical protein
MEPDGFPFWVSEVEPGSTHDITAARTHVLGALYWAAAHLDLPTLADGGYQGAGIGVHTPIRQPAGNQELDLDNRTYNALLRGLRCLGERAFALLVGRWRALRHITTSPRKISTIVKAALVLTPFRTRPTEQKVGEITSVRQSGSNTMISSGSSISNRDDEDAPGCLPGLRPDLTRDDRFFAGCFAHGASDDGASGRRESHPPALSEPVPKPGDSSFGPVWTVAGW